MSNSFGFGGTNATLVLSKYHGCAIMPGLMTGKRGLVMGVANERSIAWGIAKALADEGAALAFSHQGEAFGRRVEPLAASVGSDLLIDVDVTDADSMDRGFAKVAEAWGSLDFVVHAIAFADKDELAADFRFKDTSLGELHPVAADFLLVVHRCGRGGRRR